MTKKELKKKVLGLQAQKSFLLSVIEDAQHSKIQAEKHLKLCENGNAYKDKLLDEAYQKIGETIMGVER